MFVEGGEMVDEERQTQIERDDDRQEEGKKKRRR